MAFENGEKTACFVRGSLVVPFPTKYRQSQYHRCPAICTILSMTRPLLIVSMIAALILAGILLAELKGHAPAIAPETLEPAVREES